MRSTSSCRQDRRCRVPNVVGLTQAAATTAITGAGLSVGTVTTASEYHGAGRQRDQSEPERWYVGRTGQCGQLRGVDRAQRCAERRGPDAGCGDDGDHRCGAQRGNGDHGVSATVAAGNAISQDPSAGASVALGTAVSLVVSSGNQPLDTDGDGLSDAYEDAHGLDKLNPADALGDSDLDGFSNWSELQAGTDPFSAASKPSTGNPSTIAASVLPLSRSAQIDTTVTAFATILNANTVVATNCSIAPITPIFAGFYFYATDPGRTPPRASATHPSTSPPAAVPVSSSR